MPASQTPPGPDPHTGAAGEAVPPAQHKHPWTWIAIAGLLAAGIIGLAIYSLDLKADLDAANAELTSQQEQIDQAQDAGSDVIAAAKSAYEELSAKVGQPQGETSLTVDEKAAALDTAASCAQSVFAAFSDVFRGATVEEGIQSTVEQLESVQPLCTSVLGGTG